MPAQWQYDGHIRPCDGHVTCCCRQAAGKDMRVASVRYYAAWVPQHPHLAPCSHHSASTAPSARWPMHQLRSYGPSPGGRLADTRTQAVVRAYGTPCAPRAR